ncbi:CPCC family cysteine-rich protein, partial [Massilia pinisoli]|uniref:CPCC family cysteine-rich protein n=1 Tax=Massilia pinisoli TaxID=1772194 RepID=UPI00362E1BE8
GEYDICPVCRWEDDPFQLKDPNSEGGANEVSLKQAQKNFFIFGTYKGETRNNARQATIEEPKDEHWNRFE